MKKLMILLICLICLVGCKKEEAKKEVKEEAQEIIEEKEEYIDDNPIVLGLYDDNGKLITTYYTDKIPMTDIAVPTVYFTNEENIKASNVKYTFKRYYESYENIENYKIGYNISYIYNGKKFEKNILDPSVMFECPGIYIYLYDEFHQADGAWYSHVEVDEVTDETIFDTIKLFMIDNNIESSIKLTAFTYDGEEDFDESGNYRGNSKYSIEIVFN